MKNTIARFISTAATVAVFATGAQATAAASSLSINPASGVYTKGNNFTVSIVETGDNINVVTAILSYDASKLTCNGIGAGEFSSDAAPATCANGQVYVSRFVSGGATLSGSHTVATINFTAIATGTASLAFSAGSQVASAGVNTLSGSTGATYTLAAPTTTSTPTTPTTGGNTGTIRLNPVATSSTSTGRSNVSPTATPENNGATNQPAVLSETQKKKEDKQNPTVANTSTIQKSNTGANVAKLVALIALAGGIVVAQRYRANQLATANAAALAAAAAKKSATKKAPAKAKKAVKKTTRKK